MKLNLKNQLQLQLQQFLEVRERETGIKINPDAFISLAIQEKMESYQKGDRA